MIRAVLKVQMTLIAMAGIKSRLRSETTSIVGQAIQILFIRAFCNTWADCGLCSGLMAKTPLMVRYSGEFPFDHILVYNGSRLQVIPFLRIVSGS
jgi:hypothetical protein